MHYCTLVLLPFGQWYVPSALLLEEQILAWSRVEGFNRGQGGERNLRRKCAILAYQCLSALHQAFHSSGPRFFSHRDAKPQSDFQGFLTFPCSHKLRLDQSVS
ncbi:hypothetical protein BJX68DRAFT_240979 [Aspergillus pseudodeflectus]|uniref:Secreted protein n=1 Tax=Aspergillus pseudodeflectus TaxID=176178 RepID=A0ABR4K4X9_9EURO